MADPQKDSADKTEKPTAKRLRDARKKGDIAKSRELTSTVAILGWLGLIGLMMPTIFRRIDALFKLVLQSIGRPFKEVIGDISAAALDVSLAILLPLLVGASLLALFTEFLQVGPIVAPSRVKPDVARLNPVEGIKRMFSQENLIEVLKALVKTGALVGILLAVLFSQLGTIIKLTTAPPGAMGKAYAHATLVLAAWVIFVFFFVSVLDASYQRFAYIKRLRMSRRDIRREHKDEEGDPQIKGRRRQLHQEWANRNLVEAVKTANVVVTNPTHVAVAILYTPGETLVPVVAAKGEDHVAKIIRDAAEEAGIPIMQNIDLARGLYERAEIDEFIPVEFFEAVAELLRWADAIKKARLEGGAVEDIPAPPI
jgi:type III secretion protein U